MPMKRAKRLVLARELHLIAARRLLHDIPDDERKDGRGQNGR